MQFEKQKITIIGLGYVGLPLAIEFGKFFNVIGFDIDKKRVEELKVGIDKTNEANILDLCELINKNITQNSNNRLTFTSDINEIKDSNIYIVTVPTPINEFKAPDLNPLIGATKMLGKIISKGDIVIYESTVYPGCTEEVCVPILQEFSNLKYNQDFYCGYSPERINPGDKENTLVKIKKVTSGSNSDVANLINNLYSKIIIAGTHLAPSIKVAEASKAIENAQRDLNISFMNELALIFDKIGIDTNDVLDAASTKWNFLKFKPGLVGGHCISVDPYYLVHKAQSLGYHPEVILSGRRVNDNMGSFISNKVVKLMINKSLKVKSSSALILGFTFKENCPDIRNSKIIDVYNELTDFGINVDIYDPHANKNDVFLEYGLKLIDSLNSKKYDAIILAVSHKEFINLDFLKLKKQKESIIYDVKSYINREIVDARL